ncbi:AidA/PixA family protein [Trinickia fusca]|uniref:DNA-directed RNA polymerase subunit beta n=1 Tax=Trinickia fusca TaxID=2419777 RepID=A0A494XS30_9BURK|nr:AidA/PixA family protein [Trinickia fusca]RKP52622.1 DNA-directed RNA polymerase subunit beta [Trinickia fusca]
MEPDVIFRPDVQHIHLLAVFDTGYIKRRHGPCHDKHAWQHPIPINYEHQYLICTGSRGSVYGQASSHLRFDARVGDIVSIAATSIYANADDAVIVYAVKGLSRQRPLFQPFEVGTIARAEAAQPHPDSPDNDGLPATHEKASFTTCNSRIRSVGNEQLAICFALYALDEYSETQNLYGYYWWGPTITIR